jgi:hypothetical protein
MKSIKELAIFTYPQKLPVNPVGSYISVIFACLHGIFVSMEFSHSAKLLSERSLAPVHALLCLLVFARSLSQKSLASRISRGSRFTGGSRQEAAFSV